METIFSLAQKYYNLSNNTLADLILEYNPKITNVHLIKVHQKINIPEINEESPIIETQDQSFKILLGTFLRPGNAKAYKDEPSLKGKEIEVIPREVSPGETWYRVVAGKFDTRDEGLKTIQALKQKGLLPIFGAEIRQ